MNAYVSLCPLDVKTGNCIVIPKPYKLYKAKICHISVIFSLLWSPFRLKKLAYFKSKGKKRLNKRLVVSGLSH